MKLFMSHSSRQKLFVKELRKYLPEFLNLWIDEKELLIGENFGDTIQKTIQNDIDFLILILDSYAINSKWVIQEYKWGLEREKELGRTFVLPIVLDRDILDDTITFDIQTKKYIHCFEFTDANIKMAANNLINELFAWVCKEHFNSKKEGNQQSNSSMTLLENADKFTQNIAEKIRLLVYPYRQNNPLDLILLLDMIKEQSLLLDTTIFDFLKIIQRLQKLTLLKGIVTDGEAIWVKQEHHSWKIELHAENKKKIAKKAGRLILSDSIIALDSGSTTLKIAERISDLLRMNLIDNLTVVTNSIPIATKLMSITGELKLKDKNDILTVYMTEGRIRPNSLAVVDNDEIYKGVKSGFEEILSKLGKADICFVGANGLYKNEGLAVHSTNELNTKFSILNNSKRKIIVMDPSKLKIKEIRMFASFDDGLEILTVKDGFEKLVDDFQNHLQTTSSSLIIA